MKFFKIRWPSQIKLFYTGLYKQELRIRQLVGIMYICKYIYLCQVLVLDFQILDVFDWILF